MGFYCACAYNRKLISDFHRQLVRPTRVLVVCAKFGEDRRRIADAIVWDRRRFYHFKFSLYFNMGFLLRMRIKPEVDF